MDTWCQGGEIIQYNVVANCAIQIDLHMPPQRDISSEDISSADHNPFSYANPLRALDIRMYDGFKTETNVGSLLSDLLSNSGGTNSTDYFGIRELFTSGFQAHNGNAVQFATVKSIVVINEAYDFITVRILIARLNQPGYFSGESTPAVHCYLNSTHSSPPDPPDCLPMNSGIVANPS